MQNQVTTHINRYAATLPRAVNGIIILAISKALNSVIEIR